MKKTLLLTAVIAATALSSNADSRKWDFTKWSSETVANLKADGSGWTNDEKGDGSSNVVPDKACVWNEGANLGAACDAEGNLLANGKVIPELEGLHFTGIGAKKVAIAFDYKITTDANLWGPYEGSQYFWMNGKTTAVHFTIPAVAPGTTIKMGVESHKPSDARGVDLYVDGAKVAWSSEQTGYPTTYSEYEWVVPESESETVDVDVQPNNGCHLYYIQVGDGETMAEDLQVAYLYDKTYNGAKDADKNPIGWLANGGLDGDPIYNALQSYNLTAIDLSGEQTLSVAELCDSLLKFDAVVLSEAVGSGNSFAKAAIDVVNKVPMLSLKSFMYKSGVWNWGAGVNPSPKATALTVNEEYWEHALFDNLSVAGSEGLLELFEVDDVDALAGGNLIQGYTASAGSLIENDVVLAKVGEANAIHIHSPKRNAYMLIPVSSDNLDKASGNLTSLVYNAIQVIAPTKTKVNPAPLPIISSKLENGQTIVSIACSAADAVIYYTLDGTDPTASSTVYSEDLVVTTDGTEVKAFATAQGYNESGIASSVISVKTQLAVPTITVEGAKVTLAAADGSIYYNITGSTNVNASQIYSEPFEAPFSCTITAFCAADDKLSSEAVTADVEVAASQYSEVIKHINFGADEAWGYSSNKKLQGAINVMSPEPTDSVQVSEIVNEDGTKTPVYDYTYALIDSVLEKPFTLQPGNLNWTLVSPGQQIYFKADYNNALSYEGGPSAYGYSDVFTAPYYTKYGIGFQNVKHVREEGVANAYLVSTEKYKAPFQIGLVMANVVGSGTNQTFNTVEPNQEDPTIILKALFEISVSLDGQEWVVIDTVGSSVNKMAQLVKSLPYEKDEEVYVKIRTLRTLNLISSSNQKVDLYDIYIWGATGSGSTAIENVAIEASDDAVIFDIMGRKVNALEPGKLYIKGGRKIMVK